MTLSTSSFDAIIVGGRCAGAATALLLARGGARTLVLERSPYGSDTLSTHALMRPAVMQLSRWGVLEELIRAGTPAIEKTSFHYGDIAIDVDIKKRDGVSALYAPRRTLLDRALVDAARDAGAVVVHGARVTDLLFSSNRVCGVAARDESGVRELRAPVVIGADGIRSTVARHVGAGVRRAAAHATATIYGYFSGLDVEHNRWYYHKGVAAAAVPTNNEQVLVGVMLPSLDFARQRGGGILELFRSSLERAAPELAAATNAGVRRSPLRGHAGEFGFFRESAGRGWALVGDAGYFKDPVTAHGISDALRDAELLARAVLHGSDDALASYERQRDAVSRDLFDTTERIASFDWELEQLRELHWALGKSMKHEEELIRGFDDDSTAIAA